jgi:hypothetical protein
MMLYHSLMVWRSLAYVFGSLPIIYYTGHGYSFSRVKWGTCLLDVSTISLGGGGSLSGGIRNGVLRTQVRSLLSVSKLYK